MTRDCATSEDNNPPNINLDQPCMLIRQPNQETNDPKAKSPTFLRGPIMFVAITISMSSFFKLAPGEDGEGDTFEGLRAIIVFEIIDVEVFSV